MKKPTNPTIKVHLLPTLFILLSLLAICAIPFARAQQGSKKHSTDRAVAGEMPAVQSADGVFRGTQALPNLPSGATCQYTITQIGGSIVPGTTDTGNHGDDTVVTIAPPFPVCLYDQTFTSINLSSNGNAQFTTTDTTFTNQCLPWLTHNYTVYPYWDDLYLVNSGFGIFTSISGTAPNRIFNIEWRAQYFPGSGTANFELRLYENGCRFDVIYGTVTNSNTSATAGVQQNDTNFQQYFCNGSGGAATGGQSYMLQPCASPTPTPTPSCTPGTWVARADYPLSVYGAGNATDGTSAYVFGGNTIGGAQHAEAYRYDPVANSWSAIANVTGGADYLFHAEYGGNGKIYVMGGLNNGNLNRIYTISTNSWSTGAAVPVSVYDHGHAYANGKIYVIGGLVGGVASSGLYAYDVTANTWSTLASLPQAEFDMACGVINNKIYVAGGSTGSDFITNLYIYDIGTNTWSSGASLLVGANFPAGTVVGGQLWVIGGGNPFDRPAKDAPFTPQSFNNTQIYNPGTNSWSNGPPLNTARSFADAVTLNLTGGQAALIVGGYNSTSGTSLTSVEMNATSCGGGCTPSWRNEPSMANARRNPATAVVGSNMYAITGFNAAPDYTAASESFNGTTWTPLAPIPIPHAQSRGAAVGTNIYVPGGFNSVSFGGPLDAMQIYNTTTNTWSSGLSLPGTRGGVAAAAFNNLVYVIAGYTTPFPTVTNTVFIYNPGTNSYTTGTPMPAGQGNVAGVLYNGEIYVVGGGAAPGAQYAYNPTTNTWRTIAVLPTTGGTCQSDNGFVQDGELWIVGCLGLAINQQVWIYNSGTDSWRAGPPYSVDHQGPGAAPFNGRGFVVGGGAAAGGSAAVESIGSCAPTVTGAVSRKTHGGAGNFDVNLPLTGTDGVECRTGGGTNDYTMVVTFSGNVTVTGSPQAQVTMGSGCVGSGGVCTGNVTVSSNVVTVPLTTIANVQNINVRINGVSNAASDAPAADFNIPMGVLAGDANANRTVNAADIAQTKARLGQAVDGTNFRSDVNANGSINAADVAIIKQNSGTSIP